MQETIISLKHDYNPDQVFCGKKESVGKWIHQKDKVVQIKERERRHKKIYSGLKQIPQLHFDYIRKWCWTGMCVGLAKYTKKYDLYNAYVFRPKKYIVKFWAFVFSLRLIPVLSVVFSMKPVFSGWFSTKGCISAEQIFSWGKRLLRNKLQARCSVRWFMKNKYYSMGYTRCFFTYPFLLCFASRLLLFTMSIKKILLKIIVCVGT